MIHFFSYFVLFCLLPQLSRSDLALTTQVKLSQFRYVNVHHGIFRLRLLHFFIVFCVVITCSVLIPGIIFTYLEQNWTYFDAIYFCIISLSAVGFGDMVASESKDSSASSLVTILYVKNIYRVMTASESHIFNHSLDTWLIYFFGNRSHNIKTLCKVLLNFSIDQKCVYSSFRKFIFLIWRHKITCHIS